MSSRQFLETPTGRFTTVIANSGRIARGINIMGAGAQQRGDAVIRSQLSADQKERDDIANEVRAIEVAEECNHFVRLVMDYLVEPRGMRRPNVEGAPARRGWAKRNQKLIEAHCQWVDVDSRYAYAYHSACVKRAQAAYKLFVFALWCWRIPEHIAVPRAAQC
jgi:hypothetical protein